MKEQWTKVRGYEDKYLVSTRGRVYSLPRVITRGVKKILQPIRGRFMAVIRRKIKGNVYAVVGLSDEQGIRYFYVHRLVAEAFIPNPDNLPEVNHKNLNKTDNWVSNLEWSTSSGNKKHAVENGVLFNPNPKRGEAVGSSKLTKRKVLTILRSDKSAAHFAKKYSVTTALIYMIRRGEIWKHLYQDQNAEPVPARVKE